MFKTVIIPFSWDKDSINSNDGYTCMQKGFIQHLSKMLSEERHNLFQFSPFQNLVINYPTDVQCFIHSHNIFPNHWPMNTSEITYCKWDAEQSISNLLSRNQYELSKRQLEHIWRRYVLQKRSRQQLCNPLLFHQMTRKLDSYGQTRCGITERFWTLPSQTLGVQCSFYLVGRWKNHIMASSVRSGRPLMLGYTQIHALMMMNGHSGAMVTNYWVYRNIVRVKPQIGCFESGSERLALITSRGNVREN